MKKSINPVCFYPIVWLTVLLLFQLRYSYVLLEMNNKTLVYLLLSCLFFTLPAAVSWSKKKYYLNVFTFRKLYNTQGIAVFWALFVLFSIAVFGMFPFFIFFGVNVARYTEWGFSGFHGLLNAILMSYAIIKFGLYLITKENSHLKIALLCLLWPMLLLTRQMIMSLFVQFIFVYYYIKGIKARVFFKLGVFFVLIIIAFGLLGNLRDSGGEEMFYSLAAPTENYPRFLPSGFLWLYIYVTSPINNIVYNIDNYPLLQFSIGDAFSGLLPSPLRALLPERDNDFVLVNEALNVASSHVNFLEGFGFFGSLFYQLILGFIITMFYIRYKMSDDIKYSFIMAVLAHNIVFSFFVDFFTNLVFLFQIVFIYLFFSRVRIK